MFGSGDPDNPMGGLLGDLLKVIGSAPGGGDTWFDAARTLAHGVATDGEADDNADPLVRIAFEELARVAELHVANATGISLTAGGHAHLLRRPSVPASGRSASSSAYRPTLQLMVEAQQQGAAAVPPDHGPGRARRPMSGGLGGLLSQFALTLGPVLLGMQFGSAAGHLARRAFGQYALPAALARVEHPAARARPTWPRSPRTGACPSKRCSSGSACAS